MKKILSIITLILFITQYVYAANIPIDYMEYSSDANAQTAYVTNAYTVVTGGTISTNGTKTVHTFTSDGTFTVPDGYGGDVEYLVIAGGGGASSNQSGGGGGGGFRTDTGFAVTAQAYSITVGAGGVGVALNQTPNNGADSVFATITSVGGGGGHNYGDAGLTGGSGGGGGGTASGGAGTASQGYAGGDGGVSAGGGGGGGASEVGADNDTSGNGGDGLASSISGTSIYYAGGGGGADDTTLATGGAGGGGDGGVTVGIAYSGTANTGGGGGGQQNGNLSGGSGGSGIVIISYTTTDFGGNLLQSYSEDTIKTQGSYSLKGVATTGAINKTLTKTVAPTINLSDQTLIKFQIYSSRTGSNIKLGFHDSGGTTTESTPNITSASAWQTVTVDISAVSNANKDAIDSVIITIVNADSANTFYVDNLFDSVYNDVFGIVY